jgi:hypothetical protein
MSPEAVAAWPVDVVVLALPNGHAPAYAALARPDVVVIDLSADHRFDPAWVYGLPERTRDRVANARRIANPGCYATGIQLGLGPLLPHLAGPPHVFGVSGYSGAGTTPSPRNDPARLHDNMLPYALTGHVHEREASAQLGRPVHFMPHVGAWFRGISLTISAPLARTLRPRRPARRIPERLRRRAAHPRHRRHPRGQGRSPTTTCTSAASRSTGRPRRARRHPRQPAQGRRDPGPAEHQPRPRPARAPRGSLHDMTASSTRPTMWDKGAALDAAAQRFCAGDDVLLDRALLAARHPRLAGPRRRPRAHRPAHRRRVAALISGLDELAALVARGEFILDDRFEDGHSAIEHWLGERLGDVGRKVHTGRSRNDQVLVAMRLYLRDAIVDPARATASRSRPPA